MSAPRLAPASPAVDAALPPAGRAALRAGVVGNFVDNVHVFLPVVALAPALATLAGPGVAATTGAFVIIAMLLGRPLGGMIFGRISDKLGRTRTTKLAIAGTAVCALGIGVLPTHAALGLGTIVAVLLLRFAGGIFVAGEYSAAIPLAMEWSTPGRRGLMSGLILSMAPWAQGTIAFATAALLAALGPDDYARWGWRLLFVAGASLSAGMLAYYSRHVSDAPIFHKRKRAAASGPAGIRQVLTGRYAPMFWQVFCLMSGLWFWTAGTVLILPSRLVADVRLTATEASTVMGIASVAQALAMAVAGHLSTVVGRRRLFVAWGAAGLVLGPALWWLLTGGSGAASSAALAAALQVATVAAYGPVSAYLSERFPTQVRSTGYGMGYSLSLIVPALYPFYLPTLDAVLGRQASVMGLLVLGGVLLIAGAALGPRLGTADLDADLDALAPEAR